MTESIPPAVRDSVTGFAVAAGAANVIMQLSRLPIAYGVVESKVDSGRVDKHPIKRLRTTLSYIMVALFATENERATMRKEVNRSHRYVRSSETSPVTYNA